MRTIDFLLENLAHFVRLDESPPPGIPVHAGSDFEGRLVELCRAQSVAPIFLNTLGKLSFSPSISRITSERLNEMARAIQRSNERLFSSADMVGETLHGEGIPFLLLNDLSLAKNFYPSPRLRRINSIELLVKESDWRRIESVFREMGFVQELHVAALKDPAEVLSYFQYFSSCVFRSKDGDLVKLRFRMLDFGVPQEEEPAWKRYDDGGRDYAGTSVLSREDQLIVTGLEWNMSGFTNLLALVDLGILLTVSHGIIDWHSIIQKLRKHGFYNCFYLILRRAAQLLNLSFQSAEFIRPGKLRSKIFAMAWASERAEFTRGQKPRMPFKFYFLECDSMKKKFVLLKNVLAPRPQWVSSFFGRPCTFRLKLKYIACTMRGKGYSYRD
jgi:hypothetical protein